MIRASYSAVSAISQREELSREQKDSLLEALAGLKDSGVPKAEAYMDLHRPRRIQNPEPMARVPRTEWAPDELKNLLLQRTVQGVPVWLAIRSLENSQNPQLAALAKLVPEVFTLKSINLSNPLVSQALQAFKAAGVLSEELYNEIATMPDPSYSPLLDVPSVMEAVCGTDCILEWHEFESLWETDGS